MKANSNILFLYCFLHLLCTSKEEFITNPKLSKKNSNPIKYMILYRPNGSRQAVEQNLKKKYQESYIFSDSFFICTGQASNDYLLFGNKYYSINNKNGSIEISFLKRLPDNIKYIGYIKEKPTTTGRRAQMNNAPGDNLFNSDEDISFYGLDTNGKICLYYL